MPEAFTEAFVAVVFLQGSYRGSFQRDFFLKLPWKNIFIYYLLFIINFRKLPWKQIYFHESFRESFRDSFRESLRESFGGSKFTSTKSSVKASVKASV